MNLGELRYLLLEAGKDRAEKPSSKVAPGGAMVKSYFWKCPRRKNPVFCMVWHDKLSETEIRELCTNVESKGCAPHFPQSQCWQHRQDLWQNKGNTRVMKAKPYSLASVCATSSPNNLYMWWGVGKVPLEEKHRVCLKCEEPHSSFQNHVRLPFWKSQSLPRIVPSKGALQWLP